jgi:hypothetical protein
MTNAVTEQLGAGMSRTVCREGREAGDNRWNSDDPRVHWGYCATQGEYVASEAVRPLLFAVLGKVLIEILPRP